MKNKIEAVSLEEFRKFVQTSETYREILYKHFGITSSYKFYLQRLKERIEKEKIDTSHFTGKVKHGFSVGLISRRTLEKNMFLHDIERKCSLCNLEDVWNGKQIKLQIDHIDGNNRNNIITNLRYLCPNCHSQTDTWCNKNRGKSEKTIFFENYITKDMKKDKFIFLTKKFLKDEITLEQLKQSLDYLEGIKHGPAPATLSAGKNKKMCSCGINKIYLSSKKCFECTKKENRRNEVQIDYDSLKYKVWKMPLSVLKKEIGISDSLIIRRCKKRGIILPGRGYWAKVYVGKEKILTDEDIEELYK